MQRKGHDTAIALFLGERVRRVRFLAAVVLVGVACNATTDAPRNAFALCVHAEGIAFIPGSTGAACVAPPTVRQNQSVTVVIEADDFMAQPRSADLTIPSGAPTGWTATLGGATIAVPGQQTLTVSVPAGTPAGFYSFTLRARVSSTEEAELTFDIRVTPSGTI